MPRSGDLRPQDRGASDLRWPTRGLLDYTEPLNDTAVQAGNRITNQISAAAQQGGQKASNETVTQLLQSVGLGSVIGDTATAQLGDYLAQLLTPNSALNASNLWGLLPQQTIGKVPSTAVSSAPANILWNPDFIGAISIAGGGGWSWDSVVYYGTVTGGSAKVTANGIVRALKSNPVQVSAGQTLTVTVPVLATAVTATGNPLEVDVITYKGDTQTGIHTMAVTAAPTTGPTTNWVNPPTGSHATQLSASYLIPTDGTVDGLRLRLVVTDTATAGVVRFGAVTASITGGYLATLEADFGDAIKTGDFTPLLNALFGVPSVQPKVQVSAIPTGVPSENISGILSQPDIGTALQQAANSVLQGLTNTADPVAGFAEIANAANILQAVANSALGIAQTNSHAIAQQGVSKPTWHALDPTIDGVFNLTGNAGGSAPTIAVSYGHSAIGFIPTPSAVNKTSIVWLGQGSANISNAYVNLYKLNTSTGVLTKVWASADVVSLLPSSSVGWVYVTMPTLPVKQGDVYAAELVVTGAGVHNMVGIIHWLPQNLNIYPSQFAATRLSGASPGYASSGSGGAGNTAAVTFSANPPASVNAVVVDVSANSVPTGVKWGTTSGGAGGTAMALLGTANNGNTYVTQWGLLGPATGSQFVTAAFSSGSVAAMNSTGYTGVSGFGPTTTSSSNSASASLTVPAVVGELVHQAFGSGTVGSGFTGYDQTHNQAQRYNVNGVAFQNYSLVIGDAPGAPSVTFSAAIGSSSWGGVGTRLIGTANAVPATITSPTYTSTVPWFGLSGLAQQGQMAPGTEQFTTAGAFTFPIPGWMRQGDLIDLIGVGGGKGGKGEYGTPSNSDGGQAGFWNGRTLVFGVDIPLSATQITGSVGAGGLGATAYFTDGGVGGDTTFQAGGTTLLTCAGGTVNMFATSTGGSPGNYTFPPTPDPAATLYFGGTGSYTNAPGTPPGSGGGGAYTFSTTSGPGADGTAWIRTRQQT